MSVTEPLNETLLRYGDSIAELETVEARAITMLNKVLKHIDTPVYGAAVSIGYIQSRLPESAAVRDAFIETFTTLCDFPESNCYPVDDPDKPNVCTIATSFTSGNNLYQERVMGIEGGDEVEYGYQYWIGQAAN